MLLRRLVNEAMIGASAHVLTLTGESMSDVRMTTTDNYQGEESDIVSTWSDIWRSSLENFTAGGPIIAN